MYKGGLDWDNFEEWLATDRVLAHARKMRLYAQRYSGILFESKISMLSGFTKGKRRNVMAALANLSRFLGCYKEWKGLVADSGLKWPRQTAIEAFLSIMNVDLALTKEWLRVVITTLPKEYSNVLLFDLATGLRIGEACKSVNLLSELKSRPPGGRDYYNEEFQMLEHWKFPRLFLRRTKNAYISFISQDFLWKKEISKIPMKIQTVDRLKKALKKHGLPNRLMSIRKLHATILRDAGVQSEVVDLLHGRISESIFLRHYYRPDILHEIREKVLKATKPVIQEVMRFE